MRSTALALGSLVRNVPDDPLVPRLVRWLMQVAEARALGRHAGERRPRWRRSSTTTRSTRRSRPTSAPWSALGRRTLADRGVPRAVHRGAGEGRAHAGGRGRRRAGRAAGPLLPQGGRGHAALRRAAAVRRRTRRCSRGWTRASRSRATYQPRGRRTPTRRAAVDAFAAGALVRVTLKLVVTKERRYVAVTDPLPAGFEAVESLVRHHRRRPRPRPASPPRSGGDWTGLVGARRVRPRGAPRRPRAPLRDPPRRGRARLLLPRPGHHRRARSGPRPPTRRRCTSRRSSAGPPPTLVTVRAVTRPALDADGTGAAADRASPRPGRGGLDPLRAARPGHARPRRATSPRRSWIATGSRCTRRCPIGGLRNRRLDPAHLPENARARDPRRGGRALLPPSGRSTRWPSRARPGATCGRWRMVGGRIDHHAADGEDPHPTGSAPPRARLREMLMALRLEHRLSKREILALYLSVAPYGNQLTGRGGGEPRVLRLRGRGPHPRAGRASWPGFRSSPRRSIRIGISPRALARQRLVLDAHGAARPPLRGGGAARARAERLQPRPAGPRPSPRRTSWSRRCGRRGRARAAAHRDHPRRRAAGRGRRASSAMHRRAVRGARRAPRRGGRARQRAPASGWPGKGSGDYADDANGGAHRRRDRAAPAGLGAEALHLRARLRARVHSGHRAARRARALPDRGARRPLQPAQLRRPVPRPAARAPRPRRLRERARGLDAVARRRPRPAAAAAAGRAHHPRPDGGTLRVRAHDGRRGGAPRRAGGRVLRAGPRRIVARAAAGAARSCATAASRSRRRPADEPLVVGRAPRSG